MVTKFDIYVLITVTAGGLLVPEGIIRHVVSVSAGGLLVPEGIIHLVVSDSILTWFIRYIYYWNLQFLNHVIINKTKVLLPQTYVTLANFGYPV